jgi:RIO kinase 1
MSYIGDDRGAAPTLNEITLQLHEAGPLFAKIVADIELMLKYGRVHGDLSAYNIPYWEGDVTLIDFPQVVNSQIGRNTGHPYGSGANPDAFEILARDIIRVCDYFDHQGLATKPERLVEELWMRYVEDTSRQRLADASRWIED